MSNRGVFCEKVPKEMVGFFALALGFFKEAAQDTVILQSFDGSVSASNEGFL